MTAKFESILLPVVGAWPGYRDQSRASLDTASLVEVMRLGGWPVAQERSLSKE